MVTSCQGFLPRKREEERKRWKLAQTWNGSAEVFKTVKGERWDYGRTKAMIK